MGSEHASKGSALAIVAIAYVVAGVVAAVAGWLVASRANVHPLLVVLVADVAATAAIFAWSRAVDNSSMYDAYWSVAPMAIVAYFTFGVASQPTPRALVACGLVTAWGVRLTYNWVRGFGGLGHEDWRYVDLRKKTGGAYWLTSFFGLHLMPTLLVYLGCLALWPATTSERSIGVLDAIGAAIAFGAIVIEAAADEQLRGFRRDAAGHGAICTRGLWSLCRHPNYLGEIGFWWGLALLGFAAERAAVWVFAGPVAINVLFVFASIPMIDKRHLERRPAYRAHMQRLPALLPRPWR